MSSSYLPATTDSIAHALEAIWSHFYSLSHSWSPSSSSEALRIKEEAITNLTDLLSQENQAEDQAHLIFRFPWEANFPSTASGGQACISFDGKQGVFRSTKCPIRLDQGSEKASWQASSCGHRFDGSKLNFSLRKTSKLLSLRHERLREEELGTLNVNRKWMKATNL